MTPAATWRASASPSTAPDPANTTRAPDTSGTHSSNSEMSNACEACSSTASPGPTRHPGSPTSAATLPCDTATPFGVPVEPDVYIT
ncbi:hypothetical protein GCM10017790_63760 [Amycolatopsis oliviviridis]|uniref:Uncharacterized protein n=1 Tax=Amycolatopsis oliviviridis TaxID=1471590 RepID=A0ABQ3LZS7_9PSEU|nr:hypothetical protein GCM10017790_63760 [Amycolatopsis oliviviridis]